MREVSFLNNLRERHVTCMKISTSLITLLGISLWSIPLIFYSLLAEHSQGVVQTILFISIGLHIISGILVGVDTLIFSGSFWPLQTLVIGVSTYITFTLPGFFAFYLTRQDNLGIAYSLSALGTACISNAVLVSILFEYFHKSIAYHKTISQPRPSNHKKQETKRRTLNA